MGWGCECVKKKTSNKARNSETDKFVFENRAYQNVAKTRKHKLITNSTTVENDKKKTKQSARTNPLAKIQVQYHHIWVLQERRMRATCSWN